MLYLYCRRVINSSTHLYTVLSHPSLHLATHLSTMPPFSLLCYLSRTVLSHLSLYLGPYLFSAANLYSDTYLTQTNISQLIQLCLYQYSTIPLLTYLFSLSPNSLLLYSATQLSS
jgi:hypothetical protein